MESDLNKLLLRQLKRHFGRTEGLPDELSDFLSDISDTYKSNDEDIKLLQHSLDLSSQELRDAYLKQKQDADGRKEIIEKIQAAISALNSAADERSIDSGEIDTDLLFGSLIQLIEQRKQMEISLKENEFYLREILDSQEVGVIIIDVETSEISFINRKGADLFGAEKDEIIGQKCHDFICPTPCGDCKLLNLKETLVSGEKVLMNRKGEHIPVLKSIVHSTFNNRKCLVESFVDITERKKAEADIIKSKEEAEAANYAKSEFLANMSHEIRTPLNGVIGFSDLLMKTELNSTQLQYMQTVYHSANSLLDLLNDILDFSKIEAGKLELNPEKTDLIELYEQISDMMRFKAHEKGLELLLNIPAGLPRFIHTDSVRLRQILVNLLGNALKFTDNGEVEFSIEFTDADDSTGESSFQFSVRDTGIGIPKDKQHRIFESFSQADTTTTRKYGGTGLGLAISARLVEMMGSTLQLESSVGSGSRFFFSMKAMAEHGDPLIGSDVRKIRDVLVVDDNEKNRLIISRMLESQQIRCDLAANGNEALEMIGDDRHYDVIIMDYHMPGMNGLDTVRAIRKKLDQTVVQQPVIFLHTSSDNEEIRKESQRLGIRQAMVKPVKMTQLFSALTQVNETDFREKTDNTLNASGRKPSVHHDRYRILIVEDNRTNMILARAIISRLLPESEIVQASNGAEAVEQYRLNRPDFVFMDIQMPVMNGYDATRSIRDLETPGGKRCPIIALTAGTVKGEEARCIEAGMDDYISKPVVEETINRVLKVWLTEVSDITYKNSGMPPGSETDHFNRNELIERLDGDEELLSELITVSSEAYPDLLNDLKTAYSQKHFMEVKLVAHSIKGSARSICCHELADIATRIELMHGTDDEALEVLITELESEVNTLITEFDKYK
ncbi:MAG: multi-sensor hybrid histidine kinase [Bacteroidetes bacterium]|nr:MAG: multi-sensor hybrid histidine kinase [Bacteroidota bacterium]